MSLNKTDPGLIQPCDSTVEMLTDRAAEYRQQAQEAAAQAADSRSQAEQEREQQANAAREAEGYRSQEKDAESEAAYYRDQAEQATDKARSYESQAASYDGRQDYDAAREATRQAEYYWDQSKDYARTAGDYERQAQDYSDQAARAEQEAAEHSRAAASHERQALDDEGRSAGYEADAAGKETLVAEYEMHRASGAEIQSNANIQTTEDTMGAGKLFPWELSGEPQQAMPNPEPQGALEQLKVDALWGSHDQFMSSLEHFEQQISTVQSLDLNQDGRDETLVERFDRDFDGTPDALRVISGDAEVVVEEGMFSTEAYADLNGDHVVDNQFSVDVDVTSAQSAGELQSLLDEAAGTSTDHSAGDEPGTDFSDGADGLY
jgi:hypothetical protein